MSDKKPIILSIDDDPQVLRSLKSDLRNQYKSEYRIMSVGNPDEALNSLPQLKKKGEEVALFLVDQMMPEMLGVQFLEQAKAFYPKAKRVLLTAYSDINAAIKAINDVQLDYYLLKPWDPPTEKLYPVLDDLLDDWQAEWKPFFQGIRLIGYQYSPHTHRIKDFLAGNLRPYEFLDIEYNERGKELLELNGLSTPDLPVVVFEDGSTLSNPTEQEVATRVGLNPNAASELYDVVIIGAGPAGLGAAVYGGSEGLKTLLIEKRAPGGQAGTSSRIENYLGFPSGVSGAELSRRAITQATRFGVEFLSPQEVQRLETEGPFKKITLGDGSVLHSKAVVIATGVEYRKLPAKGIDQFSGAGVYYGAAMTEAKACENKHVYVVGGGNSAGQGAVYLAKFAKQVTILIRSESLKGGMSSYLIEQIEAIDNINVEGKREVTEVKGGDHLDSIMVKNRDTEEIVEQTASALFVFIGAKPNTEWLAGSVFRDEKQFVLVGRDVMHEERFRKVWMVDREPFLLETCMPGVFVAGDVRSGAMNRVASAVGEGAMAIKFIHSYLATV